MVVQSLIQASTGEGMDVRPQHFPVLRSLEIVPEGAHAALLLRHAHRTDIPDGEYGEDVGLSCEGIAAAEQLGAKMSGRRIGRLLSSPVARCVDTAAALARGAGWSTRVVTDRRLGAPGPFIEDPSVVGPLFLEKGTAGVVRRQLEETGPLPGMRSTAAGVSTVLDLMIGKTGNEAVLDILVTHDAILAVVAGYLTGELVDEKTWPGFLEGLFAWSDSGGLAIAWRGQSRIVKNGHVRGEEI